MDNRREDLRGHILGRSDSPDQVRFGVYEQTPARPVAPYAVNPFSDAARVGSLVEFVLTPEESQLLAWGWSAA